MQFSTSNVRISEGTFCRVAVQSKTEFESILSVVSLSGLTDYEYTTQSRKESVHNYVIISNIRIIFLVNGHYENRPM